MIVDLNRYHLLSIFLISLVVIMAASEVGRHLGVRARARGGDNISTLEGATLGLLALMIAFTFSIALSRFEARREAVLNEANAIGTTAVRARLLPAPHDSEALKLLREYVQIRLDVTQHVSSPAKLNAVISRSNELQEALWQQAMEITAKNAGLLSSLFAGALNDMFSNQAKRLAAFRARVPSIVLLVLYAIATTATAFIGYSSGLEERRLRLPVYIMGVLVAVVILLIQDLDRPDAGFITTSQQPMIDLADRIAAHAN